MCSETLNSSYNSCSTSTFQNKIVVSILVDINKIHNDFSVWFFQSTTITRIRRNYYSSDFFTFTTTLWSMTCVKCHYSLLVIVQSAKWDFYEVLSLVLCICTVLTSCLYMYICSVMFTWHTMFLYCTTIITWRGNKYVDV